MKKIWNFLKHHLKEDFHPKLYLLTGLFLVISVSLNYAFDFEDKHLETLQGYRKFFCYLLFYSIPYFFITYLYAQFKQRKDIYLRVDFWIKSLFGLTLMSLDASVPYLTDFIYATFNPKLHFWMYKVLVNMISFFTVFLPILIFYFVYDRQEKNVYGLRAHKFDVKPYFTMLLIMLPLIIAASYNSGFLRQYPMYKTSGAARFLEVPEWVTVAIYETAYGLDFVTVEYLFRGFFVIAMISVLGRGSVLSMAVIYCYLHFGKPAGEAISSIFGGFILGVVAYETRSIWGGIIVHMGIAWSMEIVAFLRKSLTAF
jgi:hypothetical protein